MPQQFQLTLSVLAIFLIPAANAADPVLPGGKNLSLKAQLGQKLFFDTNLSKPAGQSCASCHTPSVFFTDPDKGQPTSDGVLPKLKGNRNSPTAMYAAYSPTFHFDKEEGLYVGGQFLDGRAATLSAQAKAPFLNPLEMANPNKAAVVAKVRHAAYSKMFDTVYGTQALANTDTAYNRIADAIAAFERSPVFNRFSSKYDYYLYGQAKLTSQEKRGRKLFEDPSKGNCAACHPDRPARDGTPPLFTDFTYDNLGVPRNPLNPFYRLPSSLSPLGIKFVDKGLGAFVGDSSQNGKLKVPTLRNIAVTGPYMHNGYFKTLRGVVDFYNTRDVKNVCQSAWVTEEQALKNRCWPAAEVAANVNHDELGDLGLTDQEVDDIVAFLRTLTDGYGPSAPTLK